MTTVGFLHTAGVHVATFDGLVDEAGGADTAVHAVQPGLLERARLDGPTTELGEAVQAELVALAARGADVIVCTCSTLGPIAEAVSWSVDVPVFRVDRPMAGAAVRAGGRIVVVAALESTLEPTAVLLAEEALRAGTSLTVTDLCVPEAWASFESGDLAAYLRQVAEAARSAAEHADVVVLAQASMAGAQADLTDLAVPVLVSPRLAVEHARSLGRTTTIGGEDGDLDRLLSDELDTVNAAATPDVPPAEELTVRIEEGGELVAGASGWTWGQAAGIGMTWVREDRRGSGAGAELLASFEGAARERGCTHVFVTSFTFQAPAFYERLGYREIFRWEGVPTPGRDDVHLRKDL